MTLALAERYGSLSLRDCMGRRGDRQEGSEEDPLTDLSLMPSQPRSFAVPAGIEVSTI